MRRIVVTILTCGIYGLWWLVDQQRDGNRHYAVNWPWEDHLAQSVQQLRPRPHLRCVFSRGYRAKNGLG